MKTGFYKEAYRYGVSADSLLEEEETLYEIFEHPEDLMISPETYLHGACDMFAWFLAREYDYGIRAYHTEKQGYQDLLVHAVCFCDNVNYPGLKFRAWNERSTWHLQFESVTEITGN